MRTALRPYVTAGVAIVGASVIAITPVTPTPTERQAQTHAVQLTAAAQHLDAPSPFAALSTTDAQPQAAVAGLMAGSSFENPITRWIEVFQTTGASLTTLFNEVAKDPFPVVRQVIANQIGYANLIGNAVTTTVTQLSSWATGSTEGSLPVSIRLIAEYLAQGEILKAQNQLSRAITELGSALFSMLDVLSLPYEISANVTAVLQKFVKVSLFDTGIVGKTGLGVLSTVQTAFLALANTGQAIVDAGRAGDPLAALSAIVNAPAEFVDAVLNGIPNRFGRRIGGLLSITANATSWSLFGGLLIHIPRLIAAAITPPAPPADAGITSTNSANDVAALPSADAQTISLGSTAEKDAPAPTPAEQTSGEAAETATGSETDTVTEETPEPETETPATDVVDETDGTDSTDDTEGSDDSDTDGPEDSDDSESPNGATDLSGGNKAEPGKTGAGTNTGSGSGSDSADDSDSSTTDTASGTGSTNTNPGTGSNTNDSGNGAGGSNDGSDGGSDS